MTKVYLPQCWYPKDIWPSFPFTYTKCHLSPFLCQGKLNQVLSANLEGILFIKTTLVESSFLFNQYKPTREPWLLRVLTQLQKILLLGEKKPYGIHHSWCSVVCANRQKDFRGNCFWPFFEINVTITSSLGICKSRSELLGNFTHCNTLFWVGIEVLSFWGRKW